MSNFKVLMKSSERFKICSHCEGRIPVEVVICPYCASTLSDQNTSSKAPLSKGTSDSIASLYNPPYGAQRTQPTLAMEEKKKEPQVATKVEAKPLTSQKSEILPISLLVIGTNLLTLSVVQLFFSDEGFLHLEWDTHFWYVYSLMAIPLIWFGFKTLKKE